MWPQNSGRHARDDQHEEGEQLADAGHDAAGLGVGEVLGGQGALDDDLVGAPVPDGGDDHAGEDARPGDVPRGGVAEEVAKVVPGEAAGLGDGEAVIGG